MEMSYNMTRIVKKNQLVGLLLLQYTYIAYTCLNSETKFIEFNILSSLIPASGFKKLFSIRKYE